eukprot:4559909-Alexandrium_andersonii.AAC.1
MRAPAECFGPCMKECCIERANERSAPDTAERRSSVDLLCCPCARAQATAASSSHELSQFRSIGRKLT